MDNVVFITQESYNSIMTYREQVAHVVLGAWEFKDMLSKKTDIKSFVASEISTTVHLFFYHTQSVHNAFTVFAL